MSGFFFKPKHFLFMPIEDLLTTTLSQNDFLFQIACQSLCMNNILVRQAIIIQLLFDQAEVEDG